IAVGRQEVIEVYVLEHGRSTAFGVLWRLGNGGPLLAGFVARAHMNEAIMWLRHSRAGAPPDTQPTVADN
ncbi:hypothetical protein COE65_30730, partial [Bacillus sp. AFS051223]